jgi:clan AA aspartic protease (TIGR02281 family)
MDGTLLHDLLVSQAYRPVALTRTPVGHFSMRGTIDDQPVTLLLDTGASSTVIDRATAGNIGLSPQLVDNKGGGLGAVGTRTERAPVASVRLDGFQTHLDNVFVMDIATVNQTLADNGAEAVDGVVGADVLLRGRAVIDYARGVLYLQDQAAAGITVVERERV